MGVTTKLYYHNSNGTKTQVGQDINSDQVTITYSSSRQRFEHGAGQDPVDEVVSEVDSSYTTTDGRLVVDVDDGIQWAFKGSNVEVSNTSFVARLRIAIIGDHRVFDVFYPATSQAGYRATWGLTDAFAPPVKLTVVVRRV